MSTPQHEMRKAMRLAECADELEAALAQQSQNRGLAEAWQEGYRQGVLDERTSDANIGIAGFGAKVEPARNNPYAHPAPKQQAVEVTEEMVERLRDHLMELRCHYVEACDGVRGYPHREDRYTRWIEEVDADIAALAGKTEVGK